MEIGNRIIIPVRFIVLIWTIFFADLILPFDFTRLGILPRTTIGLPGIFFTPLIHGNLLHLISNTIPIFILSLILFVFYAPISKRVFYLGYIFTNVLVWIFGRPAYHCGASGLVYCIASFLVFYGIFRKEFKYILITVIILFLYGGLVYGILPTQPWVSWESHLMGSLTGFFLAWRFSETNPR